MCVCSTVLHGHVHLLVTILVTVHLQSLVLLLVYNIDTMRVNYAFMQLCTFCILSCLALGCPGSLFVMNHAFMLNLAFSSLMMESF